MIPHVVLLGREYTGGLHSTASFGTQDAPYMEPPSQGKTAAVVTNPIVFRYFVNPVTFLVNRDIAHSAKNDQVFIFIVSVITNSTLCIFLNDQASLMRTKLLWLYFFVCFNLQRSLF